MTKINFLLLTSVFTIIVIIIIIKLSLAKIITLFLFQGFGSQTISGPHELQIQL